MTLGNGEHLNHFQVLLLLSKKMQIEKILLIKKIQLLDILEKKFLAIIICIIILFVTF